MKLETAELTRVSQCFALPGVRWGAVFAGVSVGIGAFVLLALLGLCIGMAILSTAGGARIDLLGAALVWNVISALMASVVGAGLAARAGDLRRHSDGAMHGLVVWGTSVAAVSLAAVLALHGLSMGIGKVLVQAGDSQTALEMDRDMRYPRSGFITPTALRLAPLAGDGSGYVHGRPGDWNEMIVSEQIDSNRSMDPSMYIALMLCAAVGMSLCGGVAGGVLGTRKPRRPDPLDHANWRDAIDIVDR